MTETITVYDADKKPRKKCEHDSVVVFAYVEDDINDWRLCDYSYLCNDWRVLPDSRGHGGYSGATVLRWFEKPPVQKNKEKREIGVDVYRTTNSDYIVLGTLDSPLNPDRYKKVHTTTIKFED